MHKYTHRKHLSTSTQHNRLRPILVITLATFLFLFCGTVLVFAHYSQTSTNTTSVATPPHIATATTISQKPLVVTPIVTQAKSSKKMGPQQPTSTPVHTNVVATPPLITPTPQHTQLGVFPLSAGGPLPVPESVLHPTNIARLMLGSTLTSVYAGSMTRNPQQGILCVLQENMTTGELHLQMYQGPQTGGALTILTVKNSTIIIANTKMQGSFNLSTNTFQW